MVAFADSTTGILYRRSCERYGVDPARFIEDDVAAFNFRLALNIQALGEETATEDAPVVAPLPGAIRNPEQAMARWGLNG